MALRAYVFCDFEFRACEHRPVRAADLVLGVFWRWPQGDDVPSPDKVTIDLRTAAGHAQLRDLVAAWSDAIWVGYSIRAELHCLAAAGVGIRELDWIDLMVEARQITQGHRQYHAPRSGLYYVLQAFGITPPGDIGWKEAMRLLILSTDTYTEAEWAEIVRYGWSDVECLPLLLDAIQRVHQSRGHQYSSQEAIFRGDYLNALVRLDRRSRGFPVDRGLLHQVFTHRKFLRQRITELCNASLGAPIYAYNKARDDYSFRHAGLETYLTALPYSVQWPRTPTGRLKTDEETLSQMADDHPPLQRLHETLIQLRHLNARDMRELEHDGWIKGESLPYHTHTGRNQPMVRNGFLFNCAPWMRLLVKPPPGYVIIGADWASQEQVIAAALSGDRVLAQAVTSADPYIEMAKMTGSVPAHATKASHPVQRQLYKSLALGVSYGMGVTRLATKIYADLTTHGFVISLDEATERAVMLLRWHHETFGQYWQFVHRQVYAAQQRGWTVTRDGWTFMCEPYERFTVLQNWPMQACGAVILREAVKYLADETDPSIELMCSLHDALYIIAPEDEVDRHRNALIRAMTRATTAALAEAALPLPIRIETTVYTHDGGYHDARGTEMYRFILDALAEREAELALSVREAEWAAIKSGKPNLEPTDGETVIAFPAPPLV